MAGSIPNTEGRLATDKFGRPVQAPHHSVREDANGLRSPIAIDDLASIELAPPAGARLIRLEFVADDPTSEDLVYYGNDDALYDGTAEEASSRLEQGTEAQEACGNGDSLFANCSVGGSGLLFFSFDMT